MIVENAVRLDPKIFEDSIVEGKEEELFGKVGEITRVGKYYSYNLGFDTGNGGLYRLLVLDTEEKEFYFRTFFNFNEGETWRSKYGSIDPRREGADQEDLIFTKVTTFLSEMKKMLADRDDDESVKVRLALASAITPLIRYYHLAKNNAETKINSLVHSYATIIGSRLNPNEQ